jgi:hypothetical protein
MDMADAADMSRTSVAAQFEPLFAELEAERSRSDAIREQAKELDRCHRSLALLLNSVHSTKDAEKQIVSESQPIVVKIRQRVGELAELVPQGQFYRVSSARTTLQVTKEADELDRGGGF